MKHKAMSVEQLRPSDVGVLLAVLIGTVLGGCPEARRC
jgi:hypothetical protein